MQRAGDVGLEEAGDVEISSEVSIQLVAVGVDVIVTVGTDRVTGLEECTVESGIVGSGYTVVILRITVCIGLDDRIAVRIEDAHVHRIDRSNHLRIVQKVGRAPGTVGETRVGICVSVDETYVSTDLEPLLSLIISLDAGREALVS